MAHQIWSRTTKVGIFFVKDGWSAQLMLFLQLHRMEAPLKPTPGELPQFQALMKQLGGGNFGGGGAQIATIFPNVEPAQWRLPENGHVDGYNNIWSGTGANRVSATFYLNDVEEGGGCFTYWAGGAQRFHNFLRNEPEQVDGRFTKTVAFQKGNCHPYKGGDGDVAYVGKQHAAKAGTVCLWHGWTPHQASSNANEQPRLCIISRWNDKRFTVPPINFGYGDGIENGWGAVTEETRKHKAWEIPEDMFRDWGPELNGSGHASARI
eukprot:SAG31_NODE_2800_length_5077_cov_2.098433_1_plen_265_part_00